MDKLIIVWYLWTFTVVKHGNCPLREDLHHQVSPVSQKSPEDGNVQRFTMRILVDFGCDLMENHENLGIRQFLGYVHVYCL